MNKRGISPLVATVLLIAFSVALGAVVMSWGESYIEDNAEFARGVQEFASTCASVELKVIEAEGRTQACMTVAEARILLDNGPVELGAVQARLLGTAGVALQENSISTSLKPAGSAEARIGYANIGELKQVRLTPVLVSNGISTYCTEKAIIVEQLPSC